MSIQATEPFLTGRCHIFAYVIIIIVVVYYLYNLGFTSSILKENPFAYVDLSLIEKISLFHRSSQRDRYIGKWDKNEILIIIVIDLNHAEIK